MNLTRFVMRILTAIIDVFVVYVPARMLVYVLFPASGNMGKLIAQVLFVVCNVVLVISFEGKTLGKFFSKERIYLDGSYSAVHIGTRELSKLLYFTPYLGVIAVTISLFLLVATGKSLHDWIGKTQVILEREYKKLNNQEDTYEAHTLRRKIH